MPIIIEKHIEEAQSRNKWLWASFVEKHNHSGALQLRYARVDSAFQSPFFGTPFMR